MLATRSDNPDEKVIIKQIQIQDDALREDALREAKMLSQFDHVVSRLPFLQLQCMCSWERERKTDREASMTVQTLLSVPSSRAQLVR